MDGTAAEQPVGRFAKSTFTDGDLLAAFGRTGEETPFAALVRRHETMVYNACLRVLHRAADAEDAAQAVFLALSSKAREPSLHRRPSLAGWLYEAAWHVSLRAREAEKLRKQREREAGTMQERFADAAAQWSQLVPVLDGELYALPEKYRLPLVLYHLEQRSVEETAALVQCSADAAKQRLSRGREMLRDRLTRRGVLLPSGIIATLLATHASAAALPGAFAGTTAKAAVLFISGGAAAGGQAAVLARAAAEATSRSQLTRGVWAPLWAAAVLLLVGAAAGTAWRLLSPPPAAATAPTVRGEIESKAKRAGSSAGVPPAVAPPKPDGNLRRQPAPDLVKRVDVAPQPREDKSRMLSREQARTEAGILAKEKAMADVDARAKVRAEKLAKAWEAKEDAFVKAEDEKLAKAKEVAKAEEAPKDGAFEKPQAPVKETAAAKPPAEGKASPAPQSSPGPKLDEILDAVKRDVPKVKP
ncbi:MAG: sigma-70 family RNA polymerase sigma factor [Planctomycetota bacterium]|nr:sigma-70 family RNA polymerase sigma factor [Planctomycetota bacterium]